MIKCRKCTLQAIKYRNHSRLRKPSYWVRFFDEKGDLHHAYTKANSHAGYAIQNFQNDIGNEIYIKYHFTKKSGKCIIDYIKDKNIPD